MKKLLLVFLVMVISISSIFAQNKTSQFIKETFPKVHEVIVNDALKLYPGEYVIQRNEIDNQCSSFSVYILLILVDEPKKISKETLDKIQGEALIKWAKNPNINNAPCINYSTADKDIINDLDCKLAYMKVNWIQVLLTMGESFEEIGVDKSILQ